MITELKRILRGKPTRADVLREIKKAAKLRAEGQEMIDKGSADLAVWSKAGREVGVTMAEMTAACGYSRELVYYLQREHGLGKSA